MKIIATLEADFRTSPPGTRSRLADDLCGAPVLRRTVERLLRSEKLAAIHVLTDPSDRAQAESLLTGLNVAIETHQAGPPTWQAYIRSSRKWALDGWRGGLGDTTVFDESTHIWVLEALAHRENADGVVSVPAAAALIDPVLLDAMIDHYGEVREDMRLTFTQSAPGLSGVILMPALLTELTKLSQPPGRLLAYTPSQPRPDMLIKPCFYPVADEIAHAWGRCIADTQTGFDRLSALLSKHDEADLDAATVSRWLAGRVHEPVLDLPDEVEIELTTEESLPGTTLRPRGTAVGTRGAMDLEVFRGLISELSGRDDIRVVLGGFGDPLLHPKFPEFVACCREAGIFAIAVRTPAVSLDEPSAEAIISHRVDALNVLVDAATAEMYRRVHNIDRFDQVMGNLERIFDTQRRLQQPQPIVVCEMVKTRDTMDEMEAFYDYWLSKTGTAVIAGPSNCAGQWENLAVMSMAPPTRGACYRLSRRAMVLADGTLALCDQDLRGAFGVGPLTSASLSELWTSNRLREVRAAHRAGDFDRITPCRNCDEWHRP